MKTTKEIEGIVVEMYLSGEKVKTIIEETRVCETTVTNIIKRHGIHDRKSVAWIDEETNWLRENYPRLGLIKCIPYLPKRSPDAIRGQVRKMKLFLLPEIKSKISTDCKMKEFSKLNVNPEQFFNIQTSEVAYILGILWAEGSVGEKFITIKNIKTDMNEIESIFFSIGTWSKYTIKQLNRKVATQLHIGNMVLSKFLLENGYGSKSGSACQILSKIPNHLKHYWWRGYFDGDGYVRKTAYTIKLSSCYEQDWGFAETLFKSMDIKYHIKRERWWNKKDEKWNQASSIIISNAKDVLKFLNYIYTNYESDKYGFTRKYEAFLLVKARANAYFERGTCRRYN
jgi:hypothetical protein